MENKVCNISVIVPIFYGKKYIDSMITQIEGCARCLDDDTCVEIVLVNDAPNDYIDMNYSSEQIELVILNTDKNRGIQGARVYGLEHAKGEYVVFLDQDDLVKPEYLMSQMDCIGEADACVCRAIHEGKQFYDSVRVFEQVVSKEAMLEEGCGIVSPGQVLMRRAVVAEVWKQNLLEYNGADDWLLWLCMFGEGKSFALNQEVLFEHVVDGANASCNTERMMRSEASVYEIVKVAGIFAENELEILATTIAKIQSQRLNIMDKFKKQFFVLDVWMNLENKGLSVGGYLKENGYSNVAIYGYGYIGKQLHGRLNRENVEVSYIIDQNAEFLGEDVTAYTLEQELPKVDLIIVTLVEHERVIAERINEKMSVDVLSIKELLIKAEVQ